MLQGPNSNSCVTVLLCTCIKFQCCSFHSGGSDGVFCCALLIHCCLSLASVHVTVFMVSLRVCTSAQVHRCTCYQCISKGRLGECRCTSCINTATCMCMLSLYQLQFSLSFHLHIHLPTCFTDSFHSPHTLSYESLYAFIYKTVVYSVYVIAFLVLVRGYENKE